jgi:cyclopropane-fatty-acyl-phospholipid synthase
LLYFWRFPLSKIIQYLLQSGYDRIEDRETLEEAQTNKAKYILSLLDLDGTEKILDLGCGWGVMLKLLQTPW